MKPQMTDHDPLSANDTSPISFLASWANDQDAWIRLAVKQVLERRAPLDTLAIDECYSHLLAEKRLSEDVRPTVENVLTETFSAYDVPPLVLNAITSTTGINRLISNQEIRFNEQLTVIYGENASGKTGYVRVLKQVAGARTAERVLSDIYQAHPENPSATIEFSLGDQQHKFYWTEPSAPNLDLDRIIVFDPPATPLHLEDDLTYLYTPSEIALFGYVYDALTGIRERLTSDRDNRRPVEHPYLLRFQNGTSCYRAVESLRASTSLAELRELAIFDETETAAALTTLRKDLLQLQPANQDDRITFESTVLRWTKLAMDTIKALQGFDSARYGKALADVNESEEQLGYVSGRLFADHDLPGLFSDEWKTFVSATDIYASAHIHDDFPGSADTCPYCHQQLTVPARELLAKYRSYLLDESQAKLNSARAQLKSLEDTVLELSTFDDVNTLDETLDVTVAETREEPDWRSCILRVRALVIQQHKQVRSRTDWNMDIENPILEQYVASLHGRHKTAKEQLTLGTVSEDDQALRIAEVTANINSLEDRLILGQLFSTIAAYVGALKWTDLASTILGRFQPILTSLTNSEKRATETVLNSTFKEAFEAECKLLDSPDVQLTFPGRHGTTIRHKSVSTDHRMSQVLSEGEQRVVALADFLAEISLRPRPAPIVFDDPVSSLDARRRDNVAARLVSLSDECQVVVFTHDLYFASKLISAFDASARREYVNFHQVFAEDDVIGLVEQGSHPRIDTLSRVTGQINETLQNARSSTGTVRTGHIESTYDYIRTWIELFVENVLLKESVKRQRANVSVDRLRDIDGAAIDQAAGTLIEINGRASRRIRGHSQTFETLHTRPTLQELEDDWEALQNLRSGL